ncbi:hypothetical protein GCM10020000_63850 [Streptomyces olivoverticillatus]
MDGTTPSTQESTVALQMTVDPDAAEPPYEQIRARIAERARSGALPVGYKLPTVRGFAEELGLAANTVAKAYRALEADGVIETRGRNGTFIAAPRRHGRPRGGRRRTGLRPARPPPGPGPGRRADRRRERAAGGLRRLTHDPCGD